MQAPEGYEQVLAHRLSAAILGKSKVVTQRLLDIENEVKQYNKPKLEAMVQASRGSMLLYSGKKDMIETGSRLIEQAKQVHPESDHIGMIHDMLLLEQGKFPLEIIKANSNK